MQYMLQMLIYQNLYIHYMLRERPEKVKLKTVDIPHSSNQESNCSGRHRLSLQVNLGYYRAISKFFWFLYWIRDSNNNILLLYYIYYLFLYYNYYMIAFLAIVCLKKFWDRRLSIFWQSYSTTVCYSPISSTSQRFSDFLRNSSSQ